mgnify:CR=1 FL=1
MEFFSTKLFINIVIAILIILFCKIISSKVAYIIIKMFHFKVKDKNKIKKNAFYKSISSFEEKIKEPTTQELENNINRLMKSNIQFKRATKLVKISRWKCTAEQAQKGNAVAYNIAKNWS